MLHIECRGCGTSATADCACPPDLDKQKYGHLAKCVLATPLDSLIVCPPESSCCKEQHDHALAANSCEGSHAAGSCPQPTGCNVWEPIKAHHRGVAVAEEREPVLPDGMPEDCPGGHCGLGVDGCGVCRPLVITVQSATLIQRAG